MKRKRMGVMIDLDLYLKLKELAIRRRLKTYEAVEEALSDWVAEAARRQPDRDLSYSEAMRKRLGWSADSRLS